MEVIVQKYGGSSLASIEKIKQVAEKIDTKKSKHILVVSAMGSTTDDLLTLAKSITLNPKRRELDMLLTSGERISMALVSLALNEIGKPSISFTGSQCGIFTDNRHGNARIIGMNSFRVAEVLNENMICVIAGFQGVSPETKEVTTLGRGGSDTTAVAIASYFKSPRCEFKKDVTGVFSADPKAVNNPRHLEHLSFENMLNMTFWGCKVLHFRSVELAKRLTVPLHISHSEGKKGYTMVDNEKNSFEKFEVISVQSHPQVGKVVLKNTDIVSGLKEFKSLIAEKDFLFPQILDVKKSDKDMEILFVSSKDQEQGLQKLFNKNSQFDLATVSVICNDSLSSETITNCLNLIPETEIKSILFQPQVITFLIDRNTCTAVTQKLHQGLVK